MRNTILVLFLVGILGACTKTDAPLTVVYGVTYAKNGITPAPVARIFTGSGEIKDAAIIARIDAIDSFYAQYGSVDLVTTSNSLLDSVRFESQGQAVVSSYYQKTTYTVTQDNGELTLTSKDTLTGFISGVEMSRNMQYFVTTPRRELYSETLTGVSQGNYLFNYRFKDKLRVRSGGGEALDMPIMLYSWYRGSNTYAREFIPGSLDPSFYKNIASGDTVAVREYALHYAK